MTAIGDPLIRVDGRAKVTGVAKYAAEFDIPNVAPRGHGHQSTIASGRIASMVTVKAQSAPGVVAIMTPANAPRACPRAARLEINPPAGRALSRCCRTTPCFTTISPSPL